MNRKFPAATGCFVLFATALYCSAPTLAASATVAQVLQVTPSQEGVDYDRPKPEDVPRCKISVKNIDGHVGWIVESPEGILLRKFLDTNGDNVVDQWSFYKDGVEVYRDIATKPAGKKDEFRWLNTAGTRWGVDTAGNGQTHRLESNLGRRGHRRDRCRGGQSRQRSFRPGAAHDGGTPVAGAGQGQARGRGRQDRQGGHRLPHVGRSTEGHHARVEMGAVQRQPPGDRAGRHATIRRATSRSTRTSWPSSRPAKNIRKCRSAR